MAKNYKIGENYYLPVSVSAVVNTFINLVSFDGVNDYHLMINDMPDLLLTADEIATDINTERAEVMETLGKQNLELSKQNEELSAKVDDLEADLENARSVNEFAVKTEQTREKLIKEQRELIHKYGVVIDVLIDKIVALKKGENDG